MIYGLKYCTKCIMPETVERMTFDEDGVCSFCKAQEQKVDVDWDARGRQLADIFAQAKAKAGNNYDCIVPISGGKDSTYQMYILKQHGMKPLAVTFSHNWFSDVGWYNLLNGLEVFGFDHIMFTPSRELVNKCAKRSLETIGDTCWHCHAGVSAFVLQVAVKWNIPLIIWGESIAEYGAASYAEPVKFTRDYFLKISTKIDCDKFADGDLTERDLYPFNLPTAEECENLQGIYLGDYIKWHVEDQVRQMKDTYGWMGDTTVEGAIKDYKSVECSMAGMHDFTCYLKRGFGRTSIQASQDIRDCKLSREDAFQLAAYHERYRPEALDYFLKQTGLTEKRFYEIIDSQKHQSIKTELPVVPKRVTYGNKVPFVQCLLDAMRMNRLKWIKK